MLTPGFAFRQKCTLKPYLRRGVRGDEYGEGATVKCRVNFKTEKVVENRNGSVREIIAAGSVWFDGKTEVKPQDAVEIFGVGYTVVSVHPSYDLRGRLNHIEAVIA